MALPNEVMSPGGGGGDFVSVTLAHAWVNVLEWCRRKGNGHLTSRMNWWSWADSRHVLAN